MVAEDSISGIVIIVVVIVIVVLECCTSHTSRLVCVCVCVHHILMYSRNDMVSISALIGYYCS